MLVAQGFTRREMLDEVRPGRPYAGWSVREFIYHVRIADRHTSRQMGHRIDSTRIAVAAAMVDAAVPQVAKKDQGKLRKLANHASDLVKKLLGKTE